MKCPAKRFTNARHGLTPEPPEDIAYPGMYGRRVDKHGKVDWQGAEITISGSLRGWSPMWDSIPWPREKLKCGLDGCCWVGSTGPRRVSNGRPAARWKLVKPKANL